MTNHMLSLWVGLKGPTALRKTNHEVEWVVLNNVTRLLKIDKTETVSNYTAETNKITLDTSHRILFILVTHYVSIFVGFRIIFRTYPSYSELKVAGGMLCQRSKHIKKNIKKIHEPPKAITTTERTEVDDLLNSQQHQLQQTTKWRTFLDLTRPDDVIKMAPITARSTQPGFKILKPEHTSISVQSLTPTHESTAQFLMLVLLFLSAVWDNETKWPSKKITSWEVAPKGPTISAKNQMYLIQQSMSAYIQL